ncbi:siderophore ABC transporter substrate-binding protein [Lentibacillus sp. CBA3610]|uniref:siderophore ABC transporter substrate-binding protein n=1 Tax=Lentibacillus sp. CBA3610 TaxID=2518176 RepID=UPI001595B97A|nr:siderophore ABC transporter substrate-binding protein [Lentibacillus sp. CBA3610]QKY71783.1 siderophore ABC transporter substrate-binding protein [Lentibacillus sp. CBA3610]
MQKRIILGITFAMLVLFLIACGGSNNESAGEENTASSGDGTTEEDTEENAEETGSTYPMTVSPTLSSHESRNGTQSNFNDVNFESQPENIVVFDYGFLDTLDALGVEGIVGVPQGSSVPSHLEDYNSDEYTNIGTLKEPLLEDIAALEPDVIFISGRQAAFYDQLKEITPNVVYVGTDQEQHWETFSASVDIAAKMFGKQAEADEYMADLNSKQEEINNLASNFESSLVTMYNEGQLSGYSTPSRFGYVYDLYGFQPVTDDIESSSHGSNFGYEAVLEFNPEVLFVIDRTAAISDGSNIESDMENDIIQQTNAYQNDRIVYLDPQLWYLGGAGLQSELAKMEEILAELE